MTSVNNGVMEAYARYMVRRQVLGVMEAGARYVEWW
jgi:hypothetical protein